MSKSEFLNLHCDASLAQYDPWHQEESEGLDNNMTEGLDYNISQLEVIVAGLSVAG